MGTCRYNAIVNPQNCKKKFHTDLLLAPVGIHLGAAIVSIVYEEFTEECTENYPVVNLHSVLNSVSYLLCKTLVCQLIIPCVKLDGLFETRLV